MYGFLLETFQKYICDNYGLETWVDVTRIKMQNSNPAISSSTTIVDNKTWPSPSSGNEDHQVFSTHSRYPESTLPSLIDAFSGVVHESSEKIWRKFGTYFTSYCYSHGYNFILRVLGRDFRSFIDGLDDLHEYFRFTFPNIRPPSFSVINEDKNGLTLLYRSRRCGYEHYVVGQIIEVARLLYDMSIRAEVKKKFLKNDLWCHEINVYFRNTRACDSAEFATNHSSFEVFYKEPKFSIIPSSLILELFPFALLFDRDLTIKANGQSIRKLFTHDLIGLSMDHLFKLKRPNCLFTYESIVGYQNATFTIETKDDKDLEDVRRYQKKKKHFCLKGEMKVILDWNCILFIGVPNISDIKTMLDKGLYVNDLSMHDSSREMVLAGTQRSAELKLALAHEVEKSRQLEISIRKLDIEMKKTDELLYQMIPKSVADLLRHGADPLSTCQEFKCVTILFSDIINFTKICSKIAPIEVMDLLNKIYVIFDKLTENYRVYKVETIGDAYMVVSGVPNPSDDHAVQIADLGIEMIEEIRQIPLLQKSLFMNDNSSSPGHHRFVSRDSAKTKMSKLSLFVSSKIILGNAKEASKLEIFADTRQTFTKKELTTSPITNSLLKYNLNPVSSFNFTTRWLRFRHSSCQQPDKSQPARGGKFLNPMVTSRDNSRDEDYHREEEVKNCHDAVVSDDYSDDTDGMDTIGPCVDTTGSPTDPIYEPVNIRIGCHTGPCVAGVVGAKMPRYCLFGDTVNTASRMESTSQRGRIHISEETRNHLLRHPYKIVFRNTMLIKGKGEMKTFWLEGKTTKS